MRHFRQHHHMDRMQQPGEPAVCNVDFTKLQPVQQKCTKLRDPLISVITPTFNRESRIGRAICSVLNQTYPKIEMLVCDDGSSDATFDMLEKIASKDGRLKIFRNSSNCGVSYARNKLIKESDGDYIVFLDSDDELYDANVIEKISETFLANNCDMLLTDYKSAEDVGIGQFAEANPNRSVNVRSKSGTIVDMRSQPQLIYERAFWTFAYSSNFLRTRNIRFEEGLRRWEDRPFMFSALAKADSIFVSDLISRTRYWNNTSIMANLHGHKNYVRRGPEDLEMVMGHIRATRAAFEGFRENEKDSEIRKRVQLLNFKLFVERGLVDIIYLPTVGGNVNRLRSEFQAFFESMPLERGDFLKFSSVTPIRSSRAALLYKSYLAIQSGNYEDALRSAGSGVARVILSANRTGKRSAVSISSVIASESRLKKALRVNNVEQVTLHIGFHKTGSTYIQARLKERREELRRLGVLFPTSLFKERAALGVERGKRSSGHQEIITYAKRGRGLMALNFGPFSNNWSEFIREIEMSNCRHILLSAENLCFNFGEAQMRRLQEDLESVRVKIVCMIRNPANWLESYYKEMVSGGFFCETRRLTELLVPEGERLVDYYARLHPWREVFGGENVSAMSFEYALASGLSLEDYFLKEVGINLQPSSRKRSNEKENVSFGRLETEVVRVFNCCCSTVCYSTEEYRRALNNLLNALSKLDLGGDRYSILSPQGKEQICSKWSEVGTKLVEAGMLPRHHLDHMFKRNEDREEWVPLGAMPSEYLDYVFRCVPNTLASDLMRQSRLQRIWTALSANVTRALIKWV